MSRVKRTWEMGEKPVNVWLGVGLDHSVSAHFNCPQCGEYVSAQMVPPAPMMGCSCGLATRLVLKLTLEELEEKEVKGE